jgi:hypothetical protein
MYEAQVEQMRALLGDLDRRRVAAVEPDPAAELAFRDRLDALSEGTIWLRGGCESWYRDPLSGRLSTTWPSYAFKFHEAVTDLTPDELLVEIQ